MFTWLVKRSEAYKKLLSDNLNLIERTNRCNNEREVETKKLLLLRERLDEVEAKFEAVTAPGGHLIEDGTSSITFEINNDLEIKVTSKINKEITETLIDKAYIKPEHSEDEATIQLAFILIANEATEQIIENINNDEET